MADESVRTEELPIRTSFDAADSVVGNWSNGSSNVTSVVRVSNLVGNTAGLSRLLLTVNTTPSAANAAGTKGSVCWDSNYVYVCVANNTWKRAALSTWP